MHARCQAMPGSAADGAGPRALTGPDPGPDREGPRHRTCAPTPGVEATGNDDPRTCRRRTGTDPPVAGPAPSSRPGVGCLSPVAASEVLTFGPPSSVRPGPAPGHPAVPHGPSPPTVDPSP